MRLGKMQSRVYGWVAPALASLSLDPPEGRETLPFLWEGRPVKAGEGVTIVLLAAIAIGL